MKKINYTQMRTELSDILESIRKGEAVIVTQRGKPDVIINGSVSDEIYLNHPEITEGMQKARKQLSGIVNFTEAQQKSKPAPRFDVDKDPDAFEKALAYIQEKHADTIKALENK